jgi:hypothetical protein
MNLKNLLSMLSVLVLSVFAGQAQLIVTVSPPKIAAQKAVVQLKLKNNLTNKVESARAACFLLDNQGEMVGQSTKWVIGQKKVGLEPKGEMIFNFVITSPRPFASTNLTAKVSFTRLVLGDGKLGDPNKEVTIEQQLPSSNQTAPTNSATVSKPLDEIIASTPRLITIPATVQPSETVMVTNSLQPINPQQH